MPQITLDSNAISKLDALTILHAVTFDAFFRAAHAAQRSKRLHAPPLTPLRCVRGSEVSISTARSIKQPRSAILRGGLSANSSRTR
jgi:hypothetical protein